MKVIYKGFTKSVLFTIFLIHLTFLGFAATYYVSSSGSDLNSGLATATPWKTLEKVNASTFVAGDQILFKRGDTFYGSLTIKNSGSSSSRIVYGAYGTGNNPIITGFTNVTAWTNLGGNIWESTSAVSTLTDCNAVVINGVNSQMGRTPNTGYYYYQAHTTGTISSSNLTGFNWTGAECAFSSVPYIVKRLTITNASGTNLWLNGNTEIIWDNQQFIIQNDARTLDVQNEWYYNPTTKKLKIYSTSQPTNVQVSTVDQLINMQASYVTIEGITISGSNYRSVNVGGDYITIQNCDITYSGTDAIDGTWNTTGSYITINNCTISDSNHTGIAFTRFFNHLTISNCKVLNTAMIYGASAKASMSNNTLFNCAISAQCADELIEFNYVENSGYIGIGTYGYNNQVIKNNIVKTFCVHSHDGGGIYTWNGTGPNTTNTGIKILNNIVIGTQADGASSDNDSDAAIYLDDYSNGIEISGNTVSGSEYGIFLHDAHEVIVQENTAFNNDKGIRIYGKITPFYMNNITVQNNIVVAKTSGQVAIHFDPLELIKTTFKASDNCYARPISDTKTIAGYIRTPSFSALSNTVTEWQSYSGKDANSTKSPQSISVDSDMRFEYNEANTAKTVSLSQPMMDMRGVKYSGSITLQPYKSVVLIKDITSASVPGAPTSVVATAGNASASLVFTAPASNGGSAITGYTVTSIPTGGVDASAGSTSLSRTITGLTNGTAYTFTVKASNSLGTSVASAPSNSVTPQAPVTSTAFAFTGPISGSVNNASANFTVTPNNLYTGTITITPTGTGSTGLTASVLTFSNSSAAQSFTITPKVAGSITLTPTNNGTLTNSANLVYTANAVVPDAPISLVAAAGNASATITFVAPTNIGGSEITGYTVTSIPAGGTDIHAGSTLTAHTITGLTNGTAYTFAAKATNSAGTSVESALSNSVIPVALTDITLPVIQSFLIPTSATTLAVPVTAFSSSDDIGVTGYLLTETPSTPSSSATGWTTKAPITYLFSSAGSKTLYAWVKDAAGNISASLNDDVTITLIASTPEYSSYSFEELSGTIVVDSAANYDGNIIDSASRVIGKRGNGLSFNGTGYVNLGKAYGDIQNDLTLSTWVKPTPGGDYVGVIMHGGPNTDTYSLYLNHTLGTIAFKTEGATSGVWTEIANTTIWDGSWHLLTATYDGSQKIIYVDAVPVITVSATGNIDSGAGYNLLIGAGRDEIPVPSSIQYQGLLDEVRIYNYAINSSQVNGLYNLGQTSYSTEYKQICEGSDYNDWTTTGEYKRTLKSSLGGDSIVTTYLTVNPIYNVTENVKINQGESYNGWTTTGSYSRTLPAITGCDSIVTTNLTVNILVPKDGEIINSHFKTAWQGENGHNHMNIIVVSAMLDDISLTTDDEIAVFSGSLCVGATKLTRSINSADNSTFITISTSQNDGTDNGFTVNDTIIFKIWDNKNQKELIINAVSYLNDITSWTTSGSYVPGATSAVEIEAFTQYYQTIELKKGYNLFSTYLTPSDPNVISVTKSLITGGNLIKMQDESGNSLENWGNFGGWINKIGSIEKTEGYKIQVVNNCSFQIVGRPIVLPLDISLRTGWNIISFPSAAMADAKTVIQSLIDQNKLIKVQDEEGNSIENWGNFGGWKNGIGYFMPGKAYKVKMSADAVLTFQQNYLKSATILASSEKTVYFSSNVVGNGADHMNINLLGFNGSGLSIGDELAAFDGEICVGTLKITADHLSKGTGSLIVSSSTNDKSMDGFTVGNPILIYSWNQISGNESKVQTEIVNGQMNYDKNSTVLVQLKSLTTNAKNMDDIVKIDVFPNPSQGKFTVRFSQLPDSGSRIEILDISGRRVATRLISESSEEFNLDNQPAGLYIVKSILGSDEITRKLIINK